MLHRIEQKITSIRDILELLYQLKPECEDKFL